MNDQLTYDEWKAEYRKIKVISADWIDASELKAMHAAGKTPQEAKELNMHRDSDNFV